MIDSGAVDAGKLLFAADKKGRDSPGLIDF